MRILMTVDAAGGVWTYALELGGWLRARGAEVTFASMGPAPSAAQRAELVAHGISLEESHFLLEWMQEPWADLADAGDWLLELERVYRPDVVHLNGYVHAALPFMAPCVVVAHSSIPSWWRAVIGTELPSGYERYRSAVTHGLRAAARIVAPTRAMLEAIADHEPWLKRELSRAPKNMPPAVVRVIEHGISPLAIDPEAVKEPRVFYASRLWDPAKNHELLRAIARSLPWPIRLAGQAHLDDEAPGTGGPEYIGLQTRSRVLDEMRAAAVYAAPALYEPFGLSILEAAASGCALVLSDIPSLRELWGGAAMFADPRQPSAWVAAIRQLTDDPVARVRYALCARARARHYSAERMGKAYLGLYERLREERSRPSFGAA